MKHRRQLAAPLACAMAVGLCAGHVMADGAPASSETVEPPHLVSPAPDAQEDTPSPDASAGAAVGNASPSDGQAGLALRSQRKAFILDQEPISPDIPLSQRQDAAGTVSFENLGPRMVAHNLNILSLDATIDSIAAIDYDELEDNLEDALDLLRHQQNQMSQLIRGTDAAVDGLQATLTGTGTDIDLSFFKTALNSYPQSAIASLAAQMASIEDTLDDIDDGVMQDQSSSAIRQLRNAKNQIVMGGETLYLTLLGLERTQQGLQRNLAALDRTLAELEVRYEMGQISALTLAEAKAGRTALVSGMDTLSMNITGLRRQLEGMLGEEITGTIQLSPLTIVHAAELDAMDYETDLKQVKKNSYDLYAARQSLSDAEEAEDDLDLKTAADYEFDAARYTIDAAELTLKATEQSIELSFASLLDQVRDQRQVLAAAQTSYAIKQDSFAAAQLKYEQGTISYNALMEAQDALDEAADAVDTAAIDLFTYYNNYCWAVEHGILS